MQSDHVGVEVGQNRHPTDYGLTGDAKSQQNRETKQLGPFLTKPQKKNKHRDGDNCQHKGQQTVAKLNNPVNTHLRGGNKASPRCTAARSDSPNQSPSTARHHRYL